MQKAARFFHRRWQSALRQTQVPPWLYTRLFREAKLLLAKQEQLSRLPFETTSFSLKLYSYALLCILKINVLPTRGRPRAANSKACAYRSARSKAGLDHQRMPRMGQTRHLTVGLRFPFTSMNGDGRNSVSRPCPLPRSVLCQFRPRAALPPAWAVVYERTVPWTCRWTLRSELAALRPAAVN